MLRSCSREGGTRTGKRGRISAVFEKGIGNPSLAKSCFLEHPFPALRVSERDREPAEETSTLHNSGQPVTSAQTKPFPAGILPSRATSINPKIIGMVGGEKIPVFPSYRPDQSFELLSIVLTHLTYFSPDQSGKCYYRCFSSAGSAQDSPRACWEPKGLAEGRFTVGPCYGRRSN